MDFLTILCRLEIQDLSDSSIGFSQGPLPWLADCYILTVSLYGFLCTHL